MFALFNRSSGQAVDVNRRLAKLERAHLIEHVNHMRSQVEANNVHNPDINPKKPINTTVYARAIGLIAAGKLTTKEAVDEYISKNGWL